MTKNEVLKTKWGNAKVNAKGYYQITSRKEGYEGQYLHRLIFEAHYGKIPKGIVIHHLDENPLNNHINNLKAVPLSEHTSMHTVGENNPMYGRTGEKSVRYGVKLTEETKQKISKTHTGKILSDEHKKKLSEVANTSGIKNVYKKNDPRCKQGFIWAYQYYVGKKRKCFASVDIKKLEEKVKSHGLPWVILN